MKPRGNGDSSSSVNNENLTAARVASDCPVEGLSFLDEEEEIEDSLSELVTTMGHAGMVYGMEALVPWLLMLVQVICGGRAV